MSAEIPAVGGPPSPAPPETSWPTTGPAGAAGAGPPVAAAFFQKVWSPHSTLPFPIQRPALSFAASEEGCVHGAHPMLV